jgi:hypothetical protein
VRGCNEANQCADWSPSSNAVTPFGPMSAPSASASPSGCTAHTDTSGTITFGWSGGSGNGRQATYQTNIDGAGWTTQGTVPNGGSIPKSYQCNTTSHTIQVRLVRDVDGNQYTNPVSASNHLQNPPPANPSVTLSKGGNAQGQPHCTSSHCHFLHIAMHDFPSGSYRVDCMENGSKFDTGTISVSATADQDLACYNGDNATISLRVYNPTVNSNSVNPATQW